LSANTGFADFPRLCRVIALDGFLPHSFAHRGRRLVYTSGIVVPAVLSGGLLIGVGGVTDRLIPLYAGGAVLAVTLSPGGVVAAWRTVGGRHAGAAMQISGLGAVCTGIPLVVVLVSKFADGAWVMIVLVPTLLVSFPGVRRHYRTVAREVATADPLDLSTLK